MGSMPLGINYALGTNSPGINAIGIKLPEMNRPITKPPKDQFLWDQCPCGSMPLWINAPNINVTWDLCS